MGEVGWGCVLTDPELLLALDETAKLLARLEKAIRPRVPAPVVDEDYVYVAPLPQGSVASPGARALAVAVVKQAFEDLFNPIRLNNNQVEKCRRSARRFLTHSLAQPDSLWGAILGKEVVDDVVNEAKRRLAKGSV